MRYGACGASSACGLGRNAEAAGEEITVAACCVPCATYFFACGHVACTWCAVRCTPHASCNVACMPYIVWMWCASYADARRACDCADEAAEENDGDVEALKSHVGACRTELPYGSTHTRKAGAMKV